MCRDYREEPDLRFNERTMDWTDFFLSSQGYGGMQYGDAFDMELDQMVDDNEEWIRKELSSGYEIEPEDIDASLRDRELMAGVLRSRLESEGWEIPDKYLPQHELERNYPWLRQ
jgi:hypothetical protein